MTEMVLERAAGADYRRRWREELDRFDVLARGQRKRTCLEFAEQEIRIPDGPRAGRLFRADTQPYAELYLNEVDRGGWREYWATGPSQAGKTLVAMIIPLMWHLFELEETVICGLPNMDMAADKWELDIRPAIEASRYRELLPVRGGGSKGSRNVKLIRFLNGAVLRFMSGGAGDKSLAGFTSRVLVLTEIDGFDTAKTTSREANPIRQMIARLKAYGRRARVYGECTASFPDGAIWQAYTGGTESRIVLWCPVCGAGVTPEREQFDYARDADNELDAQEGAGFVCGGCGVVWTDEQRRAAHDGAVLMHKGQRVESAPAQGARRAAQEIRNGGGEEKTTGGGAGPTNPDANGGLCGDDGRSGAGMMEEKTTGKMPVPHLKNHDADGGKVERGRVVGPVPRTVSLGFRFSAVNNFFQDSGELARMEWHGAHSENPLEAEREALQFRWALPHAPDVVELAPLTVAGIAGRAVDHGRGVVPETHATLAMGVDIGSKWIHWAVVALADGGTETGPRVVDYGVVSIATRTHEEGVDAGIRDGLEQVDQLARGVFRRAVTNAETGETVTVRVVPQQIWVDTRYRRDTVLECCRKFNAAEGRGRWRPLMGFGATQNYGGAKREYLQPKDMTGGVADIGLQFHFVVIKGVGMHMVYFNSDYWKMRVQDGMRAEDGAARIGLFAAGEGESHAEYARHIASETAAEKLDKKGRRVVVLENPTARPNHWLDATGYAYGAGWFAREKSGRGVKVASTPPRVVGGEVEKKEGWILPGAGARGRDRKTGPGMTTNRKKWR